MRVTVVLRSAEKPGVAVKREQQALLEFVKRAKRGMYLHLPLWLVMGLCVDLSAVDPSVFWIDCAGFALLTALRVAFVLRSTALMAEHSQLVRQVMRVLVFMPCLQWSVLALLSTLPGPLHVLMLPLMLVTVGLATAGTVVLSVDGVVRIWFPILALIPVCIGFLLDQPGPTGVLLALMAVMVIVYVSSATRVVHDDYWAALDTRALLEERTRILELLSTTDALTQIPNRLQFEGRLEVALTRAALERHPVSVLLVDLDHFKRINDAHGHLVGDDCLKAAARALAVGMVRDTDFVARWGGEEFIVLLPGADRDAAEALAQRLLRGVAGTLIECPNGVVRLSCSIGVATHYPEGSRNSKSLIDEADGALYEAKSAGRNCVVMAA
jgi:diguanylate cyclase (GGDEF)-like protein